MNNTVTGIDGSLFNKGDLIEISGSDRYDGQVVIQDIDTQTITIREIRWYDRLRWLLKDSFAFLFINKNHLPQGV